MEKNRADRRIHKSKREQVGNNIEENEQLVRMEQSKQAGTKGKGRNKQQSERIRDEKDEGRDVTSMQQ